MGLGSNLPAVHTDYIFALICEELGLIGATVLLVFYLLLLFFGLKIAAKLRAKSHILAIAIVLLWGYQIFIVIGGILKVIPLSGMTLPLLVMVPHLLLLTCVCWDFNQVGSRQFGRWIRIQWRICCKDQESVCNCGGTLCSFVGWPALLAVVPPGSRKAPP